MSSFSERVFSGCSVFPSDAECRAQCRVWFSWLRAPLDFVLFDIIRGDRVHESVFLVSVRHVVSGFRDCVLCLIHVCSTFSVAIVCSRLVLLASV